jgi:hypothetical protein
MRLFYRPVTRKRVALFLLLLTVSEIGLPGISYALTSGPSQPEFSSFEPVSTNQLVDEFSGDFTYNIPVLSIPGPQGSDYPLSLSYHSGATPEEEASWVGYGWTLNPGAINRNTRGFPDDFTNAPVTYWNKMPANWTVTAGVGSSVEVFGKDLPLNGSFALRYNNYQGYGYNAGVGLSLGKGVVSLGYNVTDGAGSFSASINPAALLIKRHEEAKDADKTIKSTAADKPAADKTKPFTANKVSLLGGNHGLFTYSDVNRSSHAVSYYGGSFNVSVGLQINPFPVPVGATTNVFGSYSWQKNFDQEQLNAYGYMYSSDATATVSSNENAVRDYYTEKETPYNKRDNFLGIPFNNADVFSVSGEGVGGGFRLYHDKVGEFAPNKKANNIAIINLAPEISAGTTFGAGTDFGAGWQRLSEGPWQSALEGFSDAKSGADQVFFRFANDLGGQSVSSSDEPVAAQLNSANLSVPNKALLQTQLRQTAAHGRASFIAYHTAGDVYKKNSSSLRLSRGFSHRQDIADRYGLPVNYQELNPAAISEMAITTAAGGRYIYGLPVLSKAEGNLQYGIKGELLNYNYTVSTAKTDDQLDVKVGEERSTAYANSFPLTEIQTSDYVDRTLNGPTIDDFGGYTRFNYVKVYGGDNPQNWYNWRTPYNGLLYQANSLSDKADDMGAVSYGKKEVVYLQSVQTKTHTAIFVLGPRDDSRDAGEETAGADSPRGHNGTENPSSNKNLKKLVRIDLYVNSDVEQTLDPTTQQAIITAKSTAKPIKSVHFSYSSNLFSASTTNDIGLPNALINNGKRTGKLTLERVWFEYQGIPTKISPYKFSYNYPDNYSAYPAIYQTNGTQSVTTISDGVSSSKGITYYDKLAITAQNPVYDAFSLDAWGNFRREGNSRAKNMQPWLDQRDLTDSDLSDTDKSNWDPAAWQLKSITLPTGGQIQVQYEQDDYAFVQDKPVHAMVNLLPSSTDTRYFLDLAALGLNTATERKTTLKALIEQYSANTNQNRGGSNRKIFFKFLYNLSGNDTPSLLPLTQNSEYISGYATVANVDTTADGKLYLDLATGGGQNYTLPRQVCMNFLQTQRAGKLGGNDFQANRSAPERAVRDLVAWYKAVANPGNQCAALNLGLSYLRIPLIKPKKGGGLRVKRLLTYDKTGLDGSPVLYGNEYSYRTRDAQGNIISSGVATTEPGAMREENILVDYLPRQGQSVASKIISGIDRKQTEGPLGESLLPAPSVGYSQVVIRNIHSGRTSPGYSISQFATAREYPMQIKYSTLQSQTNFQLAYAFLLTNQVNNTYATQGYSFLLNNMHGQVLRKATYPGNYPGPAATQLPSPTNEQKYTYYEPAKVSNQQTINSGDAIPIVAEQGSAVNKMYPGREVDITAAQKAVKDDMLDLNFETDVDVALFFFPLFYATVIPSLTRSEAGLYTHVTSKVIRYPAVIKRVESTQDGIRHITENIAFDRLSGQAVQVQETDEFKGGYVRETTQAAWVRPEFGPKWERENQFVISPVTSASSTNAVTISTEAANQVWLNFAGNTCDGLTKITRGDQLIISTADNDGDNAIYFADKPDFLNSRVRVYPVILPFSGLATPPPGIASTVTKSIQIITSGRRNLLTVSAGSTTYHGTDYTNIKAVGPFITPDKFGSSAFTSAINSWLSNSTKTTDQFNSTSTSYTHMNMSSYANKLAGCVKDPSDVTISNVVLAKQLINGQVKVSLVSFSVACDNTTTTVLVQN